MGKTGNTDKITGKFTGKDILSLDQFDTTSIELLFTKTTKMAKIANDHTPTTLLNGYIVTLLFFEPSSRTFGSFSTAVKQIGGQTLEIQDPIKVSSVAKGETLEDTIQTFESYTDAIVMRHPEVGSMQRAANAASVPIINAGNGTGEHPTQALLDLYTLHERFGTLDNITGLLAGDLLNGRTAHSLIRGLSLYKNATLYLLSPKELQLSRSDFSAFQNRGIKLIEIVQEKDIPKDADFWYWTRVQKERFTNEAAYEKVKHSFILTPTLVKKYAGVKTALMHPLPRVGEIDTVVDSDPRALYLRTQMRNGKYVRMALIALVLGRL